MAAAAARTEGKVRRTKNSSEANLDEIQASSKIMKVNLDDLNVDRSYQRDPSQRMVDTIASDWDVVASELLLVSDRGEDWEGDRYWVVNGQHRSLAGRRVGEKRLDARIIDLSEFRDPGEVESKFRLKTNVRLGDRPLERFKAQLRAGDEQSLAIQKLLAQFDTQINDTPNSDFGINAVSGIERLYEIDSGGLLRETLQAVKNAYGQVQGKTASVALLNGVAWFLLQHQDESDRGRLIDRLKSLGVAAIDQRARAIGSTMGGAQWMNYYRAIVDFYNERLAVRSRLEPKLRGAANWKARRGDSPTIAAGRRASSR